MLNSDDIFQLKELNFNEDAATKEGIMDKTEDTFLEGESLAEAILDAGKKNDIDPYFIVSRLIQEQGKNGQPVTGNDGQQYVYDASTGSWLLQSLVGAAAGAFIGSALANKFAKAPASSPAAVRPMAMGSS